ncbi:hypothetical protein K491DRAFT_784678 [Lophiostoma macrostomum CBS 122681]|uniref:Uncharacterized protein n=1 Tax=Lophiostoma macrostomum CBS 122681 TaxID=1314788 RepID=A0A6A6SMX2_9PLEO|nr:hypothetical protein K491DRAFT_784678 [Lophiostoma macrostomum CBS 122681]
MDWTTKQMCDDLCDQSEHIFLKYTNQLRSELQAERETSMLLRAELRDVYRILQEAQQHVPQTQARVDEEKTKVRLLEDEAALKEDRIREDQLRRTLQHHVQRDLDTLQKDLDEAKQSQHMATEKHERGSRQLELAEKKNDALREYFQTILIRLAAGAKGWNKRPKRRSKKRLPSARRVSNQ